MGQLMDARLENGPLPQVSPVAAPAELAGHPDYEIIRELGQGGMGVVYLARNRLMDRLEVLKVVSRARVEEPEALERFQQEIRSAAKLAHPNIVAAYSVIRPGNLLVFCMEYVEGQDLGAIVKQRGPLPVINACYYIHQVALGLAHAHEKGMVHRDVKPGNLMVAIEGSKPVVKILDFGLAKASSGKLAEGGLTRSGQLLGTPHFVAPEQTLDAHTADICADIYSLGCTLYYLLAGRPPFEGASLYEVLHAHHSTPAHRLDLIRGDVPAALATIVEKMMAKRPAERYQRPGEVAQALKPFFQTNLPNARIDRPPAPPQMPPIQPPMAALAGQSGIMRAQAAVPALPVGPVASAVIAAMPTIRMAVPTAQPVATMPAVPLSPGLAELDRLAATKPMGSRSTHRARESGSWLGPVTVGGAVVAGLLLLASVMWKARGHQASPVDRPPVAASTATSSGDVPKESSPSTTDKPDLATGPSPPVAVMSTAVEAPAVQQLPVSPPAGPPSLPTAPFNPAQAKALQHAWAEHLGVPIETTNSIGMEFVLIPPGEYVMGSADDELDRRPIEGPQHPVRITKAFYLGKCEITQAQFHRVMDDMPAYFSRAGVRKNTVGDLDTQSFPVENVSWEQAHDFCMRLSTMVAEMQGRRTYRLPTEAEWEYACRGGSATAYAFGDEAKTLARYARFAGNSGGRPWPVGIKLANPFGLHDMHGNVWEWCSDWHSDVYYVQTPADDPPGPTAGWQRVTRGGSYAGAAHKCRSANRMGLAPASHGGDVGFRVVYSP